LGDGGAAQRGDRDTDQGELTKVQRGSSEVKDKVLLSGRTVQAFALPIRTNATHRPTFVGRLHSSFNA
jgi:hypothetical protein